GWHLSARSTTRETKLRPRTSALRACTDKTTGDSPTAPCLRVRSTAWYPISTRSFQVELGAMQRWNITTEDLKDIRHPVLSMRGSDTLPVFFEVADLLQQWIPEIDHGVDTVCEPRTCRAGIPSPSPAVSSSSSPRMIWRR